LIKRTVTTTIDAEWEIEGILPTIAEIIQIADECKQERFDRKLTLELIPRGMDSLGKTDKAKIKMKTYVNNDQEQAMPKVYRGASLT
jgi:hypothetical protein